MTRGVAAIAFLVLGALVAVSLGPFPLPDMPEPLEPLPHAIAYAAATFCLLTVLEGRGDLRRPVIGVVALSIFLMGVGLELGQIAVGRDVELADVLANALGVVTAVVGVSLIRSARRPDR